MTALSCRDFTRLLALSGSVGLLPVPAFGRTRIDPGAFDWTDAPLPPTPAMPDERFWQDVRARFLVPHDLTFLNAANLCPASLPAIEAHERNLRFYEASPSPEVAPNSWRRGARSRASSWPKRSA